VSDDKPAAGFVPLKSVTQGRPDAATALARYDAARVERTARLVRGANEAAQRFHNPALADAAGARAYVSAEWSEERTKQRYDWIFSYDATNVAV